MRTHLRQYNELQNIIFLFDVQVTVHRDKFL